MFNLLLVDKLIVFCVYLEDNRDNGKQQRQRKIAVDELKSFLLTRRRGEQVGNTNLVVLVVCHLVTYNVAPVLPVVTVVYVVSVVF